MKFAMISICHKIILIFTWYIVSKSVSTFCDSWYWWAYTDWSNYINWKLKQEFEFFCYATFYFLQVIEDLVDHMLCSVYILIYFLKLCNNELQRGCNPLSKTRQIKWSSLRQAAYKPCVLETVFLSQDHVSSIARSGGLKKSSYRLLLQINSKVDMINL